MPTKMSNTPYMSSIKKIVIIIFANLLCSIAINGLLVPIGLVSGGIAGISILIQYIFKIQTAIVIILLNIPLFIYGFKKVNKEYAIYGSISVLIYSLMLYATKDISVYFSNDDILLSALLGAAINGTGVGLLFKNALCQDGLDIIAVVIKQKYNVSIGKIVLAFNVIIVISTSFMFDLRIVAYTVLSMYTSSKFIDKIRVGFNTSKSIIIISDKSLILADKIYSDLNRSVTFLQGMGYYKKEHKQIIFLVIKNSEVVKLKELISDVDPSAFITINNTTEVTGSTFINTSF